MVEAEFLLGDGDEDINPDLFLATLIFYWISEAVAQAITADNGSL